MSFVLLVLLSVTVIIQSNDIQDSWTITGGSTYPSYEFHVLRHLTGIGPYFESNSEGLNPQPPLGCTVDKAIYQLRHGSIYVNDNDYVQTIEPFLKRLEHFLKNNNFSTSSEFVFLNTWISPITHSEIQIGKVSKFGYLEAFNMGTRIAYRYPHLLPTDDDTSFTVWASDSNRTRESGHALFEGLYSGHEKIGRILNVSESRSRGADTLTPTRTCPKFDVTRGSERNIIWLNRYSIPIIERFNKMVPTFHFTPGDILAMQELCGYETIIRGSSLYCKLFTPDEWLAFEYYFDIKYHYELGHGNNLSPSLGMPWLVAASDVLRDFDNEKQRLYLAVAHRQIVPLIVTALGMFNDSQRVTLSNRDEILPLDQMYYNREWKTSSFISFLGNFALERLHCQSTMYNGSFVRILINSAPKPLPTCSDGPGSSCPLNRYLNYVHHRSTLYEDFLKICGIENTNIPSSLNIFQTN